MERPTEGSNQVKTTAISADQARALLAVPNPTTLKGKRDRAIIGEQSFKAASGDDRLVLHPQVTAPFCLQAQETFCLVPCLAQSCLTAFRVEFLYGIEFRLNELF